MIGILAALGIGAVAAKQEISRTCETLDSRSAAKRKGSKTYVDGYGCTRWTENAHLVMILRDHEGYSCWYDLDADCELDRFGYRQHLEEEKKRKAELAKLEAERKKEFDEWMANIDRVKREYAEYVKKHPEMEWTNSVMIEGRRIYL